MDAVFSGLSIVPLKEAGVLIMTGSIQWPTAGKTGAPCFYGAITVVPLDKCIQYTFIVVDVKNVPEFRAGSCPFFPLKCSRGRTKAAISADRILGSFKSWGSFKSRARSSWFSNS
jgi:hypothetical protein